MAQNRLYRDYYSLEEESDNPRTSASRLTSSSKQTSRPRSSPGKVVAPSKTEQKVLQDAVNKSTRAQRSAADGEISSDLCEPDFSERLISPELNDSAKALPVMPASGRERDPVRSLSPTTSPASAARTSSRPIQLSSQAVADVRGQQLDGTTDLKETVTSPGNNMPPFFSRTIFHTALHSPTITHQLLKFGQSRLCGESIEFLLRINRYHALLHEVSKSISDIHADFLAESAPSQVNVPQSVLVKVNSDVKCSLASAMPRLETIFGAAQTDVEQLVYGDVYPSFVRYQLSRSASFALGGNRAKYGGLGDCFILTDPSKADNPIVFASDGFVKVTGYPRTEIIPRNCRFLQSPHTDRVVVKRIRTAIEKQEESVELLLNTRKNGEPFWNLLYTTPLLDSNRKVVFFLGGQINCSTTIHSTSDVLRVLAQSEESAETPAERLDAAQYRTKSSKGRGLFRGSNSKPEIQNGAPGMEDGLIEKLESLPISNQMRSFYWAYSNFIIINHSTFLIAFVSTGIVEMLFPIKAKTTNHAAAAGMDIFKFLSNHGSGSLSGDFKSAVKGSLKVGQAISLDLKLCAKPTMGFEKFMCHWTPLKDDRGVVGWIVLTLGSKQGR